MFDIKPIRSPEDHAAAMAEIGRLWGAPAGSADRDRLEVIATLVGLYEDQVAPIPPPDPVQSLHFHIEQGRFSAADLARVLGSRSRASEVLAGKRRLTVAMIWAIHQAFDVPLRGLVRPYGVEATNAA